MWFIFNHIRAFLLSIAMLTNIAEKNPEIFNKTVNEQNTNLTHSNKLISNWTQSVNVQNITIINNLTTTVNLTRTKSSNSNDVVKDLKLRNKKYRDFILQNTTQHFDGKIYILGLFELSTKFGERKQGKSEVGAARLAIEHINKMDYVLGYKLELLINDTMCDPGAGIDRYFHALYSKKIVTMLLGTACSNVTESLASIVPYWNILQVSFGSTSPGLSDRRKFPLFFRTVTPDSSLNEARVALIKYFGWNTIATFAQRENAYMLPLNGLVASLEAARIDCSTSITFSLENYKDQLQQLKQSDVRIVVASFSPSLMEAIFCEVYNLKMYGSDYVWLLPERRFHFPNATICKTGHVAKTLEGIITVSHYNKMPYDQKSISGLTNKDFTKLLNESQYSKFTYDAVWTMGILLRRLQDAHRLNLSAFYYDQDDFVEHMLEEIKLIKFMGASGPVSFSGSDRVGDVHVKQLQGGRARVVAYYDSTAARLTFKCDECIRVRWQGDAKPIAKRVLKQKLETIPKYAFYAIGVYSIMGLAVCLLFFYFNFHYRQMKVVKLSSPRLNNIAALGCALVFIAVILLGVDSSTLGDIQDLTRLCTVRVFLLSAGISMAFGSIFAKTYRVHRIFTYSCTTRDKLLQDWRLIILVLMLVVIDGFVVTLWIFIDPLQRRLHNLTIQVSATDRSVLYQPQVEICSCMNTTRWFLAMYGYKGFLLIMGVYMAWETRHIKVEALNDSQYIGICVYSAVFSSIMVLLSNYLSEYTLIAYLTRTLSILCTTTLTLLLLFLPKLKAVWWDGQQEPMVPGLRIESNTRRLDAEDPNELTYRMLVQNKVYRCELQALDKEIARLEELLANSNYKSTRSTGTRASWPCIQIYNISRFMSHNQLNQLDEETLPAEDVEEIQDNAVEYEIRDALPAGGKSFGKFIKGVFRRMYSISDRAGELHEAQESTLNDEFEVHFARSRLQDNEHRCGVDIEEHI